MITLLVSVILLLAAAMAIGRLSNTPTNTEKHDSKNTSWGKPFGGGPDSNDSNSSNLL